MKIQLHRVRCGSRVESSVVSMLHVTPSLDGGCTVEAARRDAACYRRWGGTEASIKRSMLRVPLERVIASASSD